MLQKYSDQSKGKKIGLYTLEERMEKIIKFKLKQYKHREKFPTIRKFSGRSNVAKFKNRFKGKFIKQIPAEAQNKIKYNCEPASNDAVLFNL